MPTIASWRRPGATPGWPTYLLLTAIGALGFVALLALASRTPESGTSLRVLGLLWFAGFGVARTVLFWNRRLGRR